VIDPRCLHDLRAVPVLTIAALSGTATRAPSGNEAASLDPSRPRHLRTDRRSFVLGMLVPFATVDGGPLAIAAPEDGTGRLFVATQDGRIWVVRADGSTVPDPLVDLRSFIKSGGEQGLLGLALHPGFPTDPRFYVDYTNTDGDTVVASLTIDPGDPNRADPMTMRQVLFVKQPFANHNGGALAFGPDGDLYVSFGDGGSGGDPQGNGQNTKVLLGKIPAARCRRSGRRRVYAVPSGNRSPAGRRLGGLAAASQPVADVVRPRDW
jgi:glucose/arabinose dehydrogenase